MHERGGPHETGFYFKQRAPSALIDDEWRRRKATGRKERFYLVVDGIIDVRCGQGFCEEDMSIWWWGVESLEME